MRTAYLFLVFFVVGRWLAMSKRQAVDDHSDDPSVPRALSINEGSSSPFASAAKKPRQTNPYKDVPFRSAVPTFCFALEADATKNYDTGTLYGSLEGVVPRMRYLLRAAFEIGGNNDVTVDVAEDDEAAVNRCKEFSEEIRIQEKLALFESTLPNNILRNDFVQLQNQQWEESLEDKAGKWVVSVFPLCIRQRVRSSREGQLLIWRALQKIKPTLLSAESEDKHEYFSEICVNDDAKHIACHVWKSLEHRWTSHYTEDLSHLFEVEACFDLGTYDLPPELQPHSSAICVFYPVTLQIASLYNSEQLPVGYGPWKQSSRLWPAHRQCADCGGKRLKQSGRIVLTMSKNLFRSGTIAQNLWRIWKMHCRSPTTNNWCGTQHKTMSSHKRCCRRVPTH